MPMIDIYAVAGTLSEPKKLTQDLAATVPLPGDRSFHRTRHSSDS
jgi:hypothetical protein